KRWRSRERLKTSERLIGQWRQGIKRVEQSTRFSLHFFRTIGNLVYNLGVLFRSTRWLQTRKGQGLISGAICALLVLTLVSTGWMKGVARGVLDAMFWMRGRVPASPHIVIVEADDSTLERYGPWPFRRSIYAELVRELHSK